MKTEQTLNLVFHLAPGSFYCVFLQQHMVYLSNLRQMFLFFYFFFSSWFYLRKETQKTYYHSLFSIQEEIFNLPGKGANLGWKWGKHESKTQGVAVFLEGLSELCWVSNTSPGNRDPAEIAKDVGSALTWQNPGQGRHSLMAQQNLF